MHVSRLQGTNHERLSMLMLTKSNRERSTLLMDAQWEGRLTGTGARVTQTRKHEMLPHCKLKKTKQKTLSSPWVQYIYIYIYMYMYIYIYIYIHICSKGSEYCMKFSTPKKKSKKSHDPVVEAQVSQMSRGPFKSCVMHQHHSSLHYEIVHIYQLRLRPGGGQNGHLERLVDC